jgi:hypothetical protein
LLRLPKRKEKDLKGKGKETAVPLPEDDESTASRMHERGVHADSTENAQEAKAPLPTELEAECAKARAVLNANIGACYVKLVRETLIVQVFHRVHVYLIPGGDKECGGCLY